MKLKYGILFLAVNCAVGNAFADGETQADGTVTINGKIVNQTCEVKGDSTNIEVTLPTIKSTLLTAEGQVAGLTPFPITLTGCSASSTDENNVNLKSIGIYFSNFNAGLNGTLKNIASPGAENVNVQLLDKNENIIKLTDDSQEQVQYLQDLPSVSTESITFDYYARYYATGESTPGEVKATVPFVIVYR